MNESSIRQKLNAIAFPLIIQNVSGQAIALTDQMFIGRISTEAYAAIGIATSLMSFIAGLLGSMAVAFNIKGANELGKGNTEAVRTGLCSSLMLDSAMGLAYILIILSSAKFIFSSVYSLSGEALESSIRYSTINCPYILFQTIIFTFNSYFKIQNRTKHILWVSTCGALVNTMLDYILIFGKCGFKPLGVSGAAIASVTGVFLNMAIYILLARKDISFHIKKCKIYLAVASELTVKSIPLIGEELLEGSVFVIVINALLAKTGIVQTGAYLLVENMLSIALLPMYMYGSAALTLTSEKLGKNDTTAVQEIIRRSCSTAMTIYIVLTVVYILCRKRLPLLISDDIKLTDLSSTIIIPMVIMNIFNPMQTIYQYVLQAYNDGKFVLYASAVANAISVAFMLVLFTVKVSLHAIFEGLFINYMFLFLVYRRRFARSWF